MQENSFKRKVYSNTILPQETRKASNRQPNFTTKTTGKRTTPQNQQKEINHNEINEKEMKETIVEINKTKSWFFEKINRIDKPLPRLIKEKSEKNQINKMLQQTMQKYKGL